MDALMLLAVLLTTGLFIYLVIALLRPEMFP